MMIGEKNRKRSKKRSSLKEATREKAPEILFVLQEGPRNFTELSSLVGGSNSTIKRRTEELERANIIEKKESGTFPRKHIFKLTKHGEVLAELLEDLRIQKGDREFLKELRMPERRILDLFHALGGKIKGRTRLQKLVFLLSEDSEIPATPLYKFYCSKYGPFSKEIFDDVKILQRKKLIKAMEKPMPFVAEHEGIVRTDYELTPRGREIAEKTFNELSERAQRELRSLQRFNKMDLGNLKEYVYSHFPDYRKEAKEDSR